MCENKPNYVTPFGTSASSHPVHTALIQVAIGMKLTCRESQVNCPPSEKATVGKPGFGRMQPHGIASSTLPVLGGVESDRTTEVLWPR